MKNSSSHSLPFRKPKTKRGSASASVSSFRIRLLIVWGLMIVSALGLTVNLFRLQVLQASTLQQRAKQQQMTDLRPFVPRRPIVDRQGNFLAIDRPAYMLYAHPKLFKEPKEKVATKLAPILGQTSAFLLTQFEQKKSGIRIASNLTEETGNAITKLKTDGLEMIASDSRLYPQQDLAAEVIGYVNTEHRGQAGVEYSQESLLERTVSTVRLNKAGNGAVMPDLVPEGFLHFDDLRLQLTIDSRLQRVARSALKQKMQEFKAKRGTVIVMDVQDGSLLALVSEPTYDPNQYSKFDVSLFKNWALTDLYEPGSTFKPLNVAIALEVDAIQPDTVFNDPGSIRVGDRVIKNAEGGGHGSLTITEILQQSSNVGMVQVMQKVPPSVYYSWLEKIGLGQSVGIDLPFEASGQLKNQERFITSAIERATTSFGQGFSLTPIHLAQLHGAIANGGKLVTPHVIRGLFDSQGEMYWQPNLNAPRSLFSTATTKTVLAMMETVVTKGTGKNARIPGYRIAGKTGTSQKAVAQGGYSSHARITSFVGILPAESPRYLVLAVVDEPQGNAFGSTVAAPIVKSVMEALIAIERIAPGG